MLPSGKETAKNGLIPQLVSQLGVNADQAKGGAGLLFKMAQSKLASALGGGKAVAGFVAGVLE